MKILAKRQGGAVIEMSYDEFSKIPTYNRNRFVDDRINAMRKKLSKYRLTHSRIVVGVVMSPFGPYTIGDLILLDGNTRQATLKYYPELIPQNPYTADFIEVYDADEAYDVYRTIDSTDAVETSSNLITGILREIGYTPQSKKWKKGGFGSILNWASKFAYDDNGLFLGKADKFAMTAFYWDQFVYFDKDGLVDDIDNNCVTFMAALFLCGKKYDVENDRFNLMVNNIVHKVTTVNNESYVDPIHFMMNTLYWDRPKSWKSGSYSIAPAIIGQILQCLDMFINNELIEKSKIKKILNSDNEKDERYFKFYLQSDKQLVL